MKELEQINEIISNIYDSDTQNRVIRISRTIYTQLDQLDNDTQKILKKTWKNSTKQQQKLQNTQY